MLVRQFIGVELIEAKQKIGANRQVVVRYTWEEKNIVCIREACIIAD